MTMMENYMDKEIDQYCTFEANQFAHHDFTLGGGQQNNSNDISTPYVNQNESVDEDFFGRIDPKQAFAVAASGNDSSYINYRQSVVASNKASASIQTHINTKESMDCMDQSIEAKVLELQRKTKEAIQAQQQNKHHKILQHVTKIANAKEEVT